MKLTVRKLLKSTNGNTPIIIICMVLIIIVIAAVVTDIAYMSVERYKLNMLTVKTVRAAAEVLASGDSGSIAEIKNAAVKKDSNLESLDIRYPNNGKEISVTAQKRVGYIFLNLIGLKDKEFKESITVRVSSVSSCKGIRPIGIAAKDVKIGGQVNLVSSSAKAGEIEIFFLDTGNGSFDTDMKYGSMNLMNTGEQVGVIEDINLFKLINQLEDVISKCRYKNVTNGTEHEPDCSRILLLPVMQTGVDNKTKKAAIGGFTAFYMEKAWTDGNRLLITGNFIRHVVKADTSDGVPDFGLRGIKIVK